MSLDDVNYVEFHADTWDYGYTLWVDGVQFAPCEPVTGITSDPKKESVELQIYPDPFAGLTNIVYSIPAREQVLLKIFDFEGKEIKTLVNDTQSAGKYNILFDSANLDPGIYFCNLITSKTNIIRKMVLIKT